MEREASTGACGCSASRRARAGELRGDAARSRRPRVRAPAEHAQRRARRRRARAEGELDLRARAAGRFGAELLQHRRPAAAPGRRRAAGRRRSRAPTWRRRPAAHWRSSHGLEAEHGGLAPEESPQRAVDQPAMGGHGGWTTMLAIAHHHALEDAAACSSGGSRIATLRHAASVRLDVGLEPMHADRHLVGAHGRSVSVALGAGLARARARAAASCGAGCSLLVPPRPGRAAGAATVDRPLDGANRRLAGWTALVGARVGSPSPVAARMIRWLGSVASRSRSPRRR